MPEHTCQDPGRDAGRGQAVFDTEDLKTPPGPKLVEIRRVKVIGRLPGETSCLTLVWAVLDRASRGWRGFTMTAAGLRQLQDLRRSLLEPPSQLRPRTATASQLRPRTATASQPGDAAENVSTVA